MNSKNLPAAQLLCAVLCATAMPALAQQYPARPVRFITVGADDAMPRLVAQELGGPLGQQVYVEDHPGASGTIGAEVASRAVPDGHSFMVATTTHMVTPHFYKLSYDFVRDFEPVTLMATSPFVLLAHPTLPVRSLQDLIKLAKANPGKLNYSATATGSTTMLSCELFKAATGVNIVHVPYKSVGAALERCGAAGLQIEPLEVSYFMSREKIVPSVTAKNALERWRDRLFTAMARNAGSVTDFFNIPTNRVVELGTRIEI